MDRAPADRARRRIGRRAGETRVRRRRLPPGLSLAGLAGWCATVGLVLGGLAAGTAAAMAAAPADTATAPDATAPAPANTVAWASADSIDAYVADAVEREKLAGFGIAVIADGDVVLARAYGAGSADGTPLSLDTPVLLGSTSKQFVGLTVQQLIAQGDLALDDTVGALLPSLADEAGPYADVTVRQLLTHHSGLGTASGLDLWSLQQPTDTLEAEARRLMHSTPVAAPGERFEYSNSNYHLLGAIVEEVTGTTYPRALERLVLDPLGLEHTSADVESPRADGFYTWFRLANIATPMHTSPVGAPSAFTAASTSDLLALLEAHLGTRTTELDSEVLAAARAPLSDMSEDVDIASGWFIRPFWELHDLDEDPADPALPRLYEHNGSSERSFSHLAFAPDVGFGIAFVTDTALGIDPARQGRLTYDLVHHILGTRATELDADPLRAWAPALMLGVPVLLILAAAALVVLTRRPPRARGARWSVAIVSAALAVTGFVLTLIVVPIQIEDSLLNTQWWVYAPDLAVATVTILALSIAVTVLLVVALLRWRRTAGSDPDAVPPGTPSPDAAPADAAQA